MEQAFVLGGGYKYMQLGEGNCFMRVPEGCEMRPVITGWFSEFAELADAKTEGEVRYGKGFMRFAGSTFDPTSQYRGAAVLDFFAEQGLSTELLRSVSQHQVGLLIETLEGLDLDPAMVSVDAGVPLESRAGFLAVRAPDAEALSVALREHGVSTDARGDRLRFGPAPYLSDAQVAQAMETLREVVPR
jgi:kynureninase